MHFHLAIVALGLSITSTFAAPLPQLAGEGAACNSIFSSTDNGVGHGIENAEDNTANLISGLHLPARRRQLAGEGAACNSIFSSTDNGVGFAIENAEDNTANLISGTKNSATGSAPPPMKRQLDKIANGAQAISQAAGTGALTTPVTGALDTLDGTTTSGAANLGAMLGDAEASTLEGIGAAVP